MASLTSDQKKPKTIIEEKVLERVKPLIPKTKKEIKTIVPVVNTTLRAINESIYDN